MIALSIVSAGSAATFTVTNTLDTGVGSLRQAITDANANTGADVIQFNIAPGGAQTITITGGIPSVTDPVTIDGTTQPGFSNGPIIEVTGAVPLTGGLVLISGSNTVRGLVLNSFGTGIYLYNGSSANRIEGNWVGLDATGKNLKGNSTALVIESGTDNIIGGTNALARNVISGGTNNGVYIVSGTHNAVLGNYIGTDARGTNSLGNGWQAGGGYNFAGGVFIEGGGSNIVGGTNAGVGNLISGNTRGVVLYNHTTGNVIQGNWMGLNAAGTGPLPGRTQISGVLVYLSDGNLIGGTVPGAGNVLSGHHGGTAAPSDGYGVQMSSGNFNLIQGNRIGTDATGMLPVPNLICGITLSGVSRTNTIGGTVSGARNVISGNTSIGIYLRDAHANLIQGNYIGAAADGASPLGNGESGIYLYSGAGNSIGGTAAAAGNIIAYNGTNANGWLRNGVTLTQSDPFTSSSGNLIRRNSFFANAERGIRLYDSSCSSPSCPPPNDLGDADAGPNDLKNTPVLTNAVTSAGSITISGTFNSTPNSAFTLEFYASPEISPSGYGEGKTYIGAYADVTDGSGHASFEAFFADAGYTGQFISATATDLAKNTSEFAADVVADGPAGAIQFGQAVFTQSESGGQATITVVRLAGTNGAVTVHYATADGTAIAGSDYTATSGVLNFASGQTSQTFTVPILNDSLNEPIETLLLTLDSVTGGAVLSGQTNAALIITDDDPIYLYAGDAAVTKPASGTTTMQIPVYLSQAAPRPISVSYATADITALAGADYLSVTGRLDFVPGVTNQLVPVTILADGLQEGSKSFMLTLSNPTNAIFGDSTAVGKIYDGTQGVLQFSSASYTVAENAGFATINLSRVGGTLGTVSVTFSVSGGSATAGSDFTLTNGVLSFSNGQTSRSFTIPITDDLINEGDETVLLQLANPNNTSLGTPASGVLTITDNDLPPQIFIQSVPAGVVLLWPTQAANFQLVSSPVVLGTNWNPVTNTPDIMGSQLVVTNPASGPKQFYRLQR